MNEKLDELSEQALAALEHGRPEEALRLADQLMSRSPDDPDALVLRADALAELGREEDAERAMEEAVRRRPNDPFVLRAAAGLVAELFADDHDKQATALERALKGEKLAHKATDHALAAELAWVQGRIFNHLGELKPSLEALERAALTLHGEPDLLLDLAVARFETLGYDKARDLFERLRTEFPDEAAPWHYLGLLAERAGDGGEAEKLFATARRLDPDSYPVPVELSEEAFRKVVAEALDRLPDKVREAMANLPVLVEDLPRDEELSGDPPLSPLSLGMFRGPTVGERSVFDPWTEIPGAIVLYRRNLQRYAHSREELLEEIETTVLHEVGHFVGWDEEDLYERGLD